MKALAIALLVILVPGGGVLAVAAWLRRRWLAREAETIDQRIKRLGPGQYRFTGQDDGLRVRTEQRRKAADAIRSRAANVETGAPVSDVLRMVKR